jgi:hypothetical protein
VSTPTPEEISTYLRLRDWLAGTLARISELEAAWADELPTQEFEQKRLIAEDPETGSKIYAERPLVEEWDQERLQAVAAEVLADGIDYGEFLKTAFEVDKRALRRQPPEIQKLVDSARIMTGHKKNGELRKPKFTVE